MSEYKDLNLSVSGQGQDLVTINDLFTVLASVLFRRSRRWRPQLRDEFLDDLFTFQYRLKRFNRLNAKIHGRNLVKNLWLGCASDFDSVKRRGFLKIQQRQE